MLTETNYSQRLLGTGDKLKDKVKAQEPKPKVESKPEPKPEPSPPTPKPDAVELGDATSTPQEPKVSLKKKIRKFVGKNLPYVAGGLFAAAGAALATIGGPVGLVLGAAGGGILGAGIGSVVAAKALSDDTYRSVGENILRGLFLAPVALVIAGVPTFGGFELGATLGAAGGIGAALLAGGGGAIVGGVTGWLFKDD